MGNKSDQLCNPLDICDLVRQIYGGCVGRVSSIMLQLDKQVIAKLYGCGFKFIEIIVTAHNW